MIRSALRFVRDLLATTALVEAEAGLTAALRALYDHYGACDECGRLVTWWDFPSPEQASRLEDAGPIGCYCDEHRTPSSESAHGADDLRRVERALDAVRGALG